MNPHEPQLKEPTLGAGQEPTAQQVLAFLKAHPDFFSAHPSVLSDINVPHPQSGQAISLVERQASILRERIKSMELKLAELLRNGQENDAISKSIQHWLRGLFLHHDTASLPNFLADSLAKVFNVPLASIAIWRPVPEFESASWVVPRASDFVPQIDRMIMPSCGPAGLSACVRLLPEAGRDAQSVAVIPLRAGAAPFAFGVLVLGSPDARRFTAELGTAYLERIGEIASAALSRIAQASAGDIS